jgi:P pilus assembly chaperone PapD
VTVEYNVRALRAAFTAGRKSRWARAAAALALLAAMPPGPLEAQQGSAAAPAQAPALPVNGNLNITPKRLTFNRGERSHTVYIYNQGTAPAVFDISMVDRVMLPRGEIESVADAQKDPKLAALVSHVESAKDMLIATPRRATLAPGKGQTIRIMVTAPPPSGPAEYRSHLTVTTVPPRNIGVTAEEAAAAEQSNRLSFSVTPLFGVSIPVIVRSAAPDVRGAITNVRLSYANLSPDGVAPPRRTPVLTFGLERTGANSLFGNIEVRSKNGKGLIGLARGVGVYTEINERMMQIPLRRVPARGEQLDISFVDDDANPGHVIARTDFVAS